MSGSEGVGERTLGRIEMNNGSGREGERVEGERKWERNSEGESGSNRVRVGDRERDCERVEMRLEERAERERNGD